MDAGSGGDWEGECEGVVVVGDWEQWVELGGEDRGVVGALVKRGV